MNEEKVTVQLRVNGESRSVTVATDETLVTTLRHDLGLMSVRSTCNIGICGVCTVLMDGLPVSACLSLSALCDGREITTSEGLLSDGQITDPVQRAFIEHSAFQCSYCTPAMVLTARSLLQEIPKPSTHDIREYLAGNLCRCGSHPQVIEAIQAVTAKVGSDA